MLSRHEFMERGHQKELLREAQRRHLIRELEAARRKSAPGFVAILEILQPL